MTTDDIKKMMDELDKNIQSGDEYFNNNLANIVNAVEGESDDGLELNDDAEFSEIESALDGELNDAILDFASKDE